MADETAVPERSSGLSGEVLSGGPEIVSRLADEWRRLCDEPGENNLPFIRPEWVEAYLQINRGLSVVCTVREHGRLVAVLPLIRRRVWVWRLPATVLRAPSDFNLWPFDVPVAAGVDPARVGQALWSAVRRSGRWDTLVIPNVPAGGRAEQLAAAAAHDGHAWHRWEYMHSAYLPLGGDVGGKEPVDFARSAHLRRDMRRAFRLIESAGGMEVAVDTAPNPVIMERLVQLEQASWKGREGDAIASREKDRSFFVSTAESAASFGYLHLCSIRVAGRIAAVSVGFSYKGEFFGHKLGWDQELKKLSLGHVLLHEVVRDCAKKGIRGVHMGGLRTAWKTQWTDQYEAHATHFVFQRGLYGAAVRLAQLRELRRLETTFPANRGTIETVGSESSGRE